MYSEAQAPWQQLELLLQQPPPHQLPAALCAHCREALPLFISDELAGQPVDRLYPEMAAHLDVCPACLHEYEEVARLATAALYGEEIE